MLHSDHIAPSAHNAQTLSIAHILNTLPFDASVHFQHKLVKLSFTGIHATLPFMRSVGTVGNVAALDLMQNHTNGLSAHNAHLL